MVSSTIINELSALGEVFKAHKIKSAFLFGSVLTQKFNDKSDVDFLINWEPNIEPLEQGELWWSLHDSLREILKREVDLLNENNLKNPYLIKEINNTKSKIYG